MCWEHKTADLLISKMFSLSGRRRSNVQSRSIFMPGVNSTKCQAESLKLVADRLTGRNEEVWSQCTKTARKGDILCGSHRIATNKSCIRGGNIDVKTDTRVSVDAITYGNCQIPVEIWKSAAQMSKSNGTAWLTTTNQNGNIFKLGNREQLLNAVASKYGQ